ncbi:trypsin-like serine peptidase [Kitasatospora mediocidica]|uniref:trypsin-like serine peptidase n=1 Tax=Kitasatospora mediocidica TaxID=58352 RepID=UPI0012FC07F7|nr:trypsin-like serine protease [Kitasatospora mediocidica]
MISQQRGPRRTRRFAVRPVVLAAMLAAVFVGAIAGVGTLTSEANASSRTAAKLSAFTTTTATGAAAAAPSPSPSSAAPSPSPSPSAVPTSATPSPAAPSPVATTPASTPSSPSGADPRTVAAAPTPSPTPTPTAAPAPASTLDSTQTAPVTAEANRVGALFAGSVSSGNHFCTASVVQSGTRNLLLTAAHCISTVNGVSFVPAYRNGQTPFGVWQVTQVFTTKGWQENNDPDQDFAFLQVAPLNGQQIQDVVGGNPLGTSAGFDGIVRLYGYPSSSDLPLLCSNTTSQFSSYQRVINCPSYPGGTSGGPWISSSTGAVTGIIGGYQQGGDTDDTSYTAYFDGTIADLYQTAVSSS